MTEFKIMEYNIRTAFHTWKDEDGNQSFEPERLEAARKVVEAENPDILILEEARAGTKHWEQKGYQHIDYQKELGEPIGLKYIFQDRARHVVLSRFPLHDRFLLPFMRRKVALVCSAQVADDKDVTLLVFHPAPHFTQEEKKEAVERLFTFDSIADAENLIVTGDFNSISDSDNYDREKLLRGFQKVVELQGHDWNPEEVVEDVLNPKVVPFLKSQGLRDTYEDYIGDEPEITNPTLLDEEVRDVGMRLDYIFVDDNFTVKDAYVVKNDDAEKASDHYPIVAVLEV